MIEVTYLQWAAQFGFAGALVLIQLWLGFKALKYVADVFEKMYIKHSVDMANLDAQSRSDMSASRSDYKKDLEFMRGQMKEMHEQHKTERAEARKIRRDQFDKVNNSLEELVKASKAA